MGQFIVNITASGRNSLVECLGNWQEQPNFFLCTGGNAGFMEVRPEIQQFNRPSSAQALENARIPTTGIKEDIKNSNPLHIQSLDPGKADENNQKNAGETKNYTKQNIRCICISEQVAPEQELVKCSNCNSYQHAICMGKNKELRPYMCPTCLIANLDPLLPVNLSNPQAVVLCPFKVGQYSSADSWDHLCQKHELAFELPRDSGEELPYVRCIKLDGTRGTYDWPPNGQLVINSKIVQNFKSPTDGKHKFTQRKEICLQENMQKVNYIMLLQDVSANISDTNSCVYVAAIVLAKKITSDILISKVLSQRKLSLLESREVFLKKLMAMNQSLTDMDDCICQESSIRLPLSDVYVPTKLVKTPCYGSLCQHIQSFDLINYVTHNERAKTWKCPICGQNATELIIDVHMSALLQIINKHKLSANSVFVEENGNIKVDKVIQITFSNGQFIVKFPPSSKKLKCEEQPDKQNAISNISCNLDIKQEMTKTLEQDSPNIEANTQNKEHLVQANGHVASKCKDQVLSNIEKFKVNLACIAQPKFKKKKNKMRTCNFRLKCQQFSSTAEILNNWIPFNRFCETAQPLTNQISDIPHIPQQPLKKCMKFHKLGRQPFRLRNKSIKGKCN